MRYSGTETLLSGRLVQGDVSSPGSFIDARIEWVPGGDAGNDAIGRLPPIAPAAYNLVRMAKLEVSAA